MNDLSKLINKKQIIYDFDCTIGRIVIDWAGWHDGAEKIIQEYDPTFIRQGGIYHLQNDMVRKYGKSMRDKMWKFTEDFEYENCTGLVLNSELVDYIKKNPQQKHHILTSNGLKNISKLLAEYDLVGLFDKIITRNNVYLLKPDPEGINQIIGQDNISDFILLGDGSSDEQTALAVGMDFEWIKMED